MSAAPDPGPILICYDGSESAQRAIKAPIDSATAATYS